MSDPTILVIPAEGDAPETELWYMHKIQDAYGVRSVLVFDYNGDRLVGRGVERSINDFFRLRPDLNDVEVHAQGGWGAYVAYRMLDRHTERIRRIFFIGGAPSDAMPPIAKWFHTRFSKLWYLSRIPFFADDPNPHHDITIAKIKRSSSAAMQRDRELYRNQLILCGTWTLPILWRCPVDAWFVPNGDAPWPAWWNNSFNNKKAAEIWHRHDVKTTQKPGSGFSFYSLMPAEPLFAVMDDVRHFPS